MMNRDVSLSALAVSLLDFRAASSCLARISYCRPYSAGPMLPFANALLRLSTASVSALILALLWSSRPSASPCSPGICAMRAVCSADCAVPLALARSFWAAVTLSAATWAAVSSPSALAIPIGGWRTSSSAYRFSASASSSAFWALLTSLLRFARFVAASPARSRLSCRCDWICFSISSRSLRSFSMCASTVLP